MSISLITLKTAQTLIADLDSNSSAYDYVLKQPVQVVVQPSREGPMMAFVPFLEYCEEFKTGIKISKTDVLSITTPVREIENQYNKLFGSGIEIASSIPKI